MTTRTRIARLIDHTLLKPEVTAAQVDALIAEAADLGVYSVCVSPSLLPLEVPDARTWPRSAASPSGAHGHLRQGRRGRRGPGRRRVRPQAGLNVLLRGTT